MRALLHFSYVVCVVMYVFKKKRVSSQDFYYLQTSLKMAAKESHLSCFSKVKRCNAPAYTVTYRRVLNGLERRLIRPRTCVRVAAKNPRWTKPRWTKNATTL